MGVMAPTKKSVFYGLSNTFPSKGQEKKQALILSDRVWTLFMWCKLLLAGPFSV